MKRALATDGLDTVDCTGIALCNTDVVIERADPNPEPEHPCQVWPPENDEPWGMERDPNPFSQYLFKPHRAA